MATNEIPIKAWSWYALDTRLLVKKEVERLYMTDRIGFITHHGKQTDGHDLDDWFQAECEIKGTQANAA